MFWGVLNDTTTHEGKNNKVSEKEREKSRQLALRRVSTLSVRRLSKGLRRQRPSNEQGWHVKLVAQM